MDDYLMELDELRAVVNCFRNFHGSESFSTAADHARNLSAAGHLRTAAVWSQIAAEVSHLETHDCLERCLQRAA